MQPHLSPLTPPQANTSTFQQRYFLCDRHHKRHGPIFFYLGNEADVTLYLNNTGARSGKASSSHTPGPGGAGAALASRRRSVPDLT